MQTQHSKNGNGGRLWWAIGIIAAGFLSAAAGGISFAIDISNKVSTNATKVESIEGSLVRIESKLDRLIERGP